VCWFILICLGKLLKHYFRSNEEEEEFACSRNKHRLRWCPPASQGWEGSGCWPRSVNLTQCLSRSRLTLERVYLRSRSWLEWRKRRALRVLGCNPLRLLLRVLPTLEKVHSDMELDVGMHKMARTAHVRIRNLSDFTRHHGNRPTSCLTSSSSRGFFRVLGWSRTSLSLLEALNSRYSANSWSMRASSWDSSAGSTSSSVVSTRTSVDKDGARPFDEVLLDHWWTLSHTTRHGRR